MSRHSSHWASKDASRTARWLAPAIILGILGLVVFLVWLNSRSDLAPWQ